MRNNSKAFQRGSRVFKGCNKGEIRCRSNRGSFNSTRLIVSSKLPRFPDLYTLSVTSADPKSVSANKPVHFTKSVTKWFARDGILVEGLFWKDVSELIDDYSGDSRKNK